MNESNKYRDITTGVLFVTGIFGFVSGAFIISTTLFGAASLISNLDFATSTDSVEA
jgi:CheY-specific phosphatase CheX